MNKFFEGLASQNNAEVTSVVTADNFNLRAGGYITINKGVVSMNISYWADVYRSSFPGYTSVDDCDWDVDDTFISGVRVDSISKFNEGLRTMGLSSISESLNIDDKDIHEQVIKCIANSKTHELVFGHLKLFNALSAEDKRKVVLNYSIANYDKCNPYTLNQHGLSESPNTKPSLEELIKLRNELI